MFAKTRLALLVGWVTGGVAFPLLAQETTKNETIVVTSQMQSGATKIATPDIETPQSVSIITREQFEEQGAISVRQAVSYTPGVYSNQIGASNRFDYIVLRGFSDGSLDNVYLDGLKMMGDTNSHSSLVVDPWFLENIEVVRGPASVLYGTALRPAASSPSPRVNPHSIPAGKLSCLPGITTSAGRRLTLPGRWTITIAWRRA